MAKRTLAQVADLIEDMVDKSRDDTTFDTFVQNMAVLTLQEIIAEVPYARWLLEESTITTAASTQYVSLPADVDIDAIVGMRDETNDKRIIRINPEDADAIDPGRDLSGDEILWWFQRVGGADRIYFLNKPDSIDTLYLISGEIITDPTSAQSSALPAKYESIWIHGTLIKVWERLDPDHDTTKHERLYSAGIARIKKDADSNPGGSDALASHRPNLSSGVSGPSFPANFDILP